MYLSRFPSLSLRQLVSFNKLNQFEKVFDPAKTAYYYRGANAVFNAVKVLGLKSADVVLMPAYHCGIEVEAVLKAGGSVKFYGVTASLHVDINDLTSQIDSRTKALFVIHYFGFPQDMQAIKTICAERNILLIEDCAHALMSTYSQVPLGKFGDVSIFSFQKSLPIPDGGALVINTGTFHTPGVGEAPTKLTLWRGVVVLCMQHTRMFHAWCYAVLNILFIHPARWLLRLLKKRQPQNFAIQTASTACFDDSKASLSISSVSLKQIQSSNLENMYQKRRENYKRLQSFLPKAYVSQLVFPALPEGVCPLFFPIRFPDRKMVVTFLEGKNIETFIFGEFLHPNLAADQFPQAQKCSQEILGLPIHQDMQERHMEYLGQAIRQYYAGRLA
jgi:dTDP-4-amino-4,6-dideoxygalactose transaminase